MTASTSVDPSADAVAWSAVVLREDEPDDRARLAELSADPGVVVLDHSDRVQHELATLTPELSPAGLAESRRWVWYPWRRTLASLPGPITFRRLRLDRNRNKITAAEQDRFSGLTIGIVGLSVGHSIAHTIALEGLCGRLRLADFDTIELSNLNRIPSTVLDIGVNKAVAASRRIAELDPYLPIEVFTDGLQEANLGQFLDGLDLLVEECDSLDVKVRVREEARARGIPVVMETSDRGLFDVERFDREPDRPLLHGLLGEIGSQSLRGLSTHDKAPHVMRILQSDALSARMAASMVEIDRTVSTWPQLGGDVQLGGATVAAAIRRLGRGEELPSGRVRVDLDKVLDTLGDHALPDPAPAPSDDDDGILGRPPERAAQAVVHAIRLAPSGGNVQPWSLRVEGDRVDVLLARERTSAMDVQFRGSYVGIGAAQFNAEVAAARHGRQACVRQFPQGPGSDLVLSIELREGPVDPELAQLYPAMLARCTNRGFGRRRPFDADGVASFQRQAATTGSRLHLISDPAGVSAIADILAESDRIRYLTPVLHQQMMSELRWPEEVGDNLGIDVSTLDLDTTDLAKLGVARRSDVMDYLARWQGGAALGDTTRDRVNASSAVAVLTVAGDTPTDYLRGGRALALLWTRANQCGLAVHPVSPVFLFARDEQDRAGLSAELTDELTDLQARFAATVGLPAAEAPVLVVRVSHDVAPAARSRRLSDAAVLLASTPPTEGEQLR